MPSPRVETLRSFPETAESLAVLAEALSERTVVASRRVFATDDNRSSDEGLALLKSYVAVPDRRVRQALLDVLVAIADIDPHA